MTEEDKADIEKQITSEVDAKRSMSRNAWRNTAIAGIGSLAFFASMLMNVHRTYQGHGSPIKSLETHDYLLVSIPVLVLGYVFYELGSNGTQSGV